MSRKEKERYWTRHVRAFEASGLSRPGYCKQHALRVRSLDYWRRRLGKDPGAREFVALRVSASSLRDEPLVLECGNGAKLKLPRDCDPAWLSRLLSGLGAC